MNILGIHEGHDAHACIVRDGRLVAVVGEERLNKLKACQGYPKRAIDAVIALAGIDPMEIDKVAYTQRSDWIWKNTINKNARFSIQDWIEECEVYWKPRLLEGADISELFLFDHFSHLAGSELQDDPYLPMVEMVRNAPQEQWQAIGDGIRQRTIKAHLGLPADRIAVFRHEDCHKAYGFFSSLYPRERTLVMTLEAGGQDSSATVSTLEPTGAINEHWRSNQVNAGRLYLYVTLLLGMKPNQHEYKVMGLAPFGTEYHGRRSLEYFRNVNRVDGTEIVNDGLVPELYYTVGEALRAERFDGIAWGLQTWLEELLAEWVDNNAKTRGIDNVVLSGGVAQNIKANKAIAELDSVRHLWVGAISGDGSLGVGAAWLASRQFAPEIEIEAPTNVYLGTEHDRRQVASAIERHGLQRSYKLIERPSADTAAGWIEDGKIVARFSGRMEFGQRALGNRSIMADPRRDDTVERVNRKIKYRDFWMPFTPSMLVEEAERMVENPKGLYSPFMTMAFDLKEAFRNAIPAATHPADKTVRPQMLRREDNPSYYDIIAAFKARTGLGCVMNTSFNLHGDPIAESPDDAIRTFENSDLDVLLFDDVAVARDGVAD
ncbi:MAG TPA: carbamoyltransferase C-terminal domain-containing protein [Thermohalobaculum sp.]|nr:carbamoyltransferase C-terminal domain-containing protein [Thermohalobaculum sp.]